MPKGQQRAGRRVQSGSGRHVIAAPCRASQRLLFGRHERGRWAIKRDRGPWGAVQGWEEQSLLSMKPAPGTHPSSCSRRCSERFHADACIQRPASVSLGLELGLCTLQRVSRPSRRPVQCLKWEQCYLVSRLAWSSLGGAHCSLDVTSLPARAETEVRWDCQGGVSGR